MRPTSAPRTLHNAELLRQGKLTDLDVEDITEDLESTGASEHPLEQSPSLQRLLGAKQLAKVSTKAMHDAVIETDFDRHPVPIDCPYRLEQMLYDDWLSD